MSPQGVGGGRRTAFASARLGVGACLAMAIPLAVLATQRDRRDFDSLLREYRFGDADQAVASFAAWPSGRLGSEAKLRDGDRDPWVLAALVLLHSEAEVRRTATWAQHYDVLRTLGDRLDHVARERADPLLRAFVRDWFITQLAPGQRFDVWTDLKDRMPDDSRVQLALGARMEYVMPRIESAGPTSYSFGIGGVSRTTSHGQFGHEADLAMERFRRTLELDPTVVMARVRLGRVLLMMDRRAEAERELVQARKEADSAGTPVVSYLAGLFLGQVLDELRRPDEAIEVYRKAVGAVPSGLSARVGLGRLLIARGEILEGQRVVAEALSAASGVHGPVDPWTTYFQYQHAGIELEARLRDLRRQVRP